MKKSGLLAICLVFMTMLTIGCSEKKEQSQNQQQAEQSDSYENVRRRLHVKKLEEMKNLPQVKLSEIKKENGVPEKVNRDSVLAREISSAVECYRFCSIKAQYVEGNDTVNVYGNRFRCKRHCNDYENIIPVNSCNRICLAAGDEFIERTGYVMDRTYFARFVLEVCDETCPCASAFDSLAFKKNVSLILDSINRTGDLDSVVYDKNAKALHKIKGCYKTKNSKKCSENLAEYRRNRFKKFKDCGLQ